MDIGSISIWQLLIVVVILFLSLWPTCRILNRAGYSRWWVLTMYVPLINIILIWVFAFSDWPIHKKSA